MAQIQHSFSKNDGYYTPAYEVYPIMKFLNLGTAIWCPPQYEGKSASKRNSCVVGDTMMAVFL